MHLDRRAVKVGIPHFPARGYAVASSTGRMPNLRALLHQFIDHQEPTHQYTSITLRRGGCAQEGSEYAQGWAGRTFDLGDSTSADPALVEDGWMLTYFTQLGAGARHVIPAPTQRRLTRWVSLRCQMPMGPVTSPVGEATRPWKKGSPCVSEGCAEHKDMEMHDRIEHAAIPATRCGSDSEAATGWPTDVPGGKGGRGPNAKNIHAQERAYSWQKSGPTAGKSVLHLRRTRAGGWKQQRPRQSKHNAWSAV